LKEKNGERDRQCGNADNRKKKHAGSVRVLPISGLDQAAEQKKDSQIPYEVILPEMDEVAGDDSPPFSRRDVVSMELEHVGGRRQKRGTCREESEHPGKDGQP